MNENMLIGTSLPKAAHNKLLEVGDRYGWRFRRSGKINESRTARHLILVGLAQELGHIPTVNVATGEATHE